jgi:magnesium-dependent phosphatase 1
MHILRTKFWELAEKSLSRGCIYLGCSAGAIVAGRSISTAYWKGWDEPEVGLEWNDETLRGRQLVDFDIFPHYDAHQHKELVESRKSSHSFNVVTVSDNMALVNSINDGVMRNFDFFVDGALANVVIRKVDTTNSSSSKLKMSTQSSSFVAPLLPKLVVFDLDMCLWAPEMYTLDEVPSEENVVRGELADGQFGVIGVKSGWETIRLFPAALKVLQEIHDGKYTDLRIAAASSADTPLAVEIGKKAMGLLEVFPGVTVRDVFARGWPDGFNGNMQIGRTPPLSSDKAVSHFPIILRETSIPYSEMLFFDDCNWGDHCGNVEKRCPGLLISI